MTDFLGIRCRSSEAASGRWSSAVVIMVIVLFFRQGIMGDKELPDIPETGKRSSSAGKRKRRQ